MIVKINYYLLKATVLNFVFIIHVHVNIIIFNSSYDTGEAISQWTGTRTTTLSGTLVRVLKLLEHPLIVNFDSPGVLISPLRGVRGMMEL